jgi:hypothetical protein
MAKQEQDIRLDILNTLLTTPHRELNKVWPVHRDLIAKDPRFYVQLAAWYFDHGAVRDHKEIFIVALVLSDFAGHRDAGLAMLRKLPPYQVVRVVDFISGTKQTRRASKIETNRVAQSTSKRQRRAAAKSALTGTAMPVADAQQSGEAVMVTEQFGLFRNVPRAMKTEVKRYLREREANADRFDGAVLHARRAIKRLYALLHIKPGTRAQQILFEGNPPKDSRLFHLRALAAADKPADQARAIVEHRIPYRVAATVVRQMTPAVLVALIDQMSPQELINNVGSLRKRGAMDNDEIREMIESKLKLAKTDTRVSALKAQQAVQAAGVSNEMKKQLEDVADTQVKAKGRISRPTALLIDKSSSMQVAIELGRQIGALVSTVCESDLFAYAFDTLSYRIDSSGTDLASWGRALKGINASGATSCGVSLVQMTKAKQRVGQIVMITDEGHNTAPAFVPSYRAYCEAVGASPSVCIVRTPRGIKLLERQCREAGIEVDVFQFDGDYYSLPNLVPMLSRPSKLELLMEIMQYDLPARKAA